MHVSIYNTYMYVHTYNEVIHKFVIATQWHIASLVAYLRQTRLQHSKEGVLIHIEEPQRGRIEASHAPYDASDVAVEC
jgi:hypothetical protein